jgi:hypothetical protein
VHRWEFNNLQVRAAFDEMPATAREALRAFMEALVFDPAEYERALDEPAGRALRTLSFGGGAGIVTVHIYSPDLLVLVVQVQWLG